MSDIVNLSRPDFDKAIEFLKGDISSLRTGRATPALVEDIVVEAYGTKQPLKAVASITVQDAKTLLVDPWDKSLVVEVDRAIRNSSAGVNPVNDGNIIRIPLPELSMDRRQELIKVLYQKLENARIAIRKIREDVRNKIDNAEKNKELSEDAKYKANELLEKTVKEYNDKVKEIGEEKEKEISAI
jgi:ribosome recycling factor